MAILFTVHGGEGDEQLKFSKSLREDRMYKYLAW